jgi:hypothetical protein
VEYCWHMSNGVYCSHMDGCAQHIRHLSMLVDPWGFTCPTAIGPLHDLTVKIDNVKAL